MAEKEQKKTLAEQKYHDVLVMQVWRLIGTFVLGGVGGYLVYRSSQKSGEPNILYWFVVWGIVTLIGVLAFVILVLRARKQLNINKINEKNE